MNSRVTPEFTGNKTALNRRNVREHGNDLYFFSTYGRIYRYDSSREVMDEWANFEKEFEGSYLVDTAIKGGALWILTNRFILLKIDLQTKNITYSYSSPGYGNVNSRCLYAADDG